MSQDMSHDDFSQRLQELSKRIAAAKAALDAGSKLDGELSQRHMQEAEQRHAALKAEFKKTDKHGWEQFKVSLSQSLEDLLDEFGHLFTDADDKTRHRK